jgi:predicted membrane channel-forming protein YqfA (hemolysin III family)
MMWRTLIEALWIVAGLIGAAVFASLATWSVPSSRDSIWGVAYVSMVVLVLMGISPIRQALARDRASRGDARHG